MDDLTRREALIAAGAVTAGGVIAGSAAASAPPDDSGVAYPRTKNPFKYGLSRSPMKVNNFVPQGWAHYIRNVGDVDMIWVLVFNAPLTDIGLSDMFNGMPTSTFQQTLGISFAGAKKQSQTDFIV